MCHFIRGNINFIFELLYEDKIAQSPEKEAENALSLSALSKPNFEVAANLSLPSVSSSTEQR